MTAEQKLEKIKTYIHEQLAEAEKMSEMSDEEMEDTYGYCLNDTDYHDLGVDIETYSHLLSFIEKLD